MQKLPTPINSTQLNFILNNYPENLAIYNNKLLGKILATETTKDTLFLLTYFMPFSQEREFQFIGFNTPQLTMLLQKYNNKYILVKNIETNEIYNLKSINESTNKNNINITTITLRKNSLIHKIINKLIKFLHFLSL